jgi:hypothetical protein
MRTCFAYHAKLFEMIIVKCEQAWIENDCLQPSRRPQRNGTHRQITIARNPTECQYRMIRHVKVSYRYFGNNWYPEKSHHCAAAGTVGETHFLERTSMIDASMGKRSLEEMSNEGSREVSPMVRYVTEAELLFCFVAVGLSCQRSVVSQTITSVSIGCMYQWFDSELKPMARISSNSAQPSVFICQ